MNQPSTVTVILTRIWSYLKAHRWIMLLAIISMALVAASEAGIPALLKPLLDKGFGAKDQASRIKWLVPLAVIGLALVRGAAQYASNYLLSWVSNRVLLDLRLHMFQRMLHASAFFFPARDRQYHH